MFCPKCGSILRLKKQGSKKMLACLCGYVDKSKENMIIKERTEKVNINVVEESDEENLPTTKTVCPKCKNKEAYFWSHQTRGADEPETKFLKCTKCKHVWRDYS